MLVYTLIAFTWWSVLLYTKNSDAFEAKAQLLHIGMVAEGIVKSPEQFYESERYLTLQKEYRRQENMILGETLFLVFTLLGGMYIVYRSYQQEVTSSNQQRNFLLSITHELKSPIASVRLILETLEKRGEKLNASQFQTLTQSGVQESERLNNLVENLLLSAKLEAAYQVHPEEVLLDEIVLPIVNRLSKQYSEAQIKVNISPELPPFIGDRMGLSAVIQNLLENALKYSPTSANIELEIQPLTKEKWSIQVKDQGVGISKQEKAMIFQKFYRVGNEDTRKTKGTGLGLFIVSQVVKAHQGSIRVEDNTPTGSVFIVELPQKVKSKS